MPQSLIYFLLHWAITSLSLWVASYVFSGIKFADVSALVISALLLGFANAIVRPLLILLTLPLTVLTLGLFYLVVNGAAFGLAAAIVPGFSVASLGSAILGALIVALVSAVVSWLMGPPPQSADSGH